MAREGLIHSRIGQSEDDDPCVGHLYLALTCNGVNPATLDSLRVVVIDWIISARSLGLFEEDAIVNFPVYLIPLACSRVIPNVAAAGQKQPLNVGCLTWMSNPGIDNFSLVN